MSNNSDGSAFADHGRFVFTISADAEDVSISRPVSREDIERVRRQIAEWEARQRSRESS